MRSFGKSALWVDLDLCVRSFAVASKACLTPARSRRNAVGRMPPYPRAERPVRGLGSLIGHGWPGRLSGSGWRLSRQTRKRTGRADRGDGCGYCSRGGHGWPGPGAGSAGAPAARSRRGGGRATRSGASGHEGRGRSEARHLRPGWPTSGGHGCPHVMTVLLVNNRSDHRERATGNATIGSSPRTRGHAEPASGGATH
jgi:hypothetical protein